MSRFDRFLISFSKIFYLSGWDGRVFKCLYYWFYEWYKHINIREAFSGLPLIL